MEEKYINHCDIVQEDVAIKCVGDRIGCMRRNVNESAHAQDVAVREI